MASKTDQYISVEDCFADLTLGDHLCCLYRDSAEQCRILSAFFREGLRRRERLLYIADESSPDQIDKLLHNGFSVNQLKSEGRLMIFSSAETYRKNNVFDPDEMIALLEKTASDSLRDGFSGLCITGEMTWALQGLSGTERLTEYEARLNRVLPASSAVGLCQYNIGRMNPATVMKALETHPIVIIGESLVENFYYIQPEKLLGSNPDKARLELRMENLLNYDRTRRELWALRMDLESKIQKRTEQLALANRKLEREVERRQKIETDLRDEEEKLNAMINAIRESAFLIDRKGRVLAANDTGAARLGFSRNDLIGRGLFDYLPSDVAIRRKKVIDQVVREKRSVRYSDRRSGRSFDTTLWPIADPRGDVDRLAVFATDTTKAERLVEDLKLKEAAIDSSMSAIAFADADFRLTFVNRAFLQMWGYSANEEVLGRPITAFWESVDDARRIVARIVETGRWIGELSGRKKDGTIFFSLVSASEVRNRDSEKIGYMGAFVDISQRIWMERDLKEKTRRLEETNTALKVVMEHRDTAGERLAENVRAGINTLILPYLRRIRDKGLAPSQATLAEVMEKNLEELTSSLPVRLSFRHAGITPRELEVAAMIRQGKTSDEIAQALHVSTSAVVFHRQSLRRKLGLRGRRKGLRAHLQEIMK